MARSLEGLLLLNVVFLLAGLGLFWGIHGWRTWRDLGAESGIAYMTGLGAVTVVGTVALALGGTLSTALIVATAGLVGGAGAAVGVARGRPLPGRPRRGRLSNPERLALLPAAATAAVLADMYGLARNDPLTASDAWSSWLPKAKAIYFFGGLDERLFRTLDGASSPILTPTLNAMGFHFMGAADTTTLSVQYWLLLVGFVLAVAGLLRGLAPLPLVWLFLLLAVVVPELDSRLLDRLADWPLDIFFVLAALGLVRRLLTGERWPLAVYGVMLAAALATRHEGRLLAAVLVVGGLAASGLRRRREWVPIVGIALAAYAVNVPWRIWWTSRGIAADSPGDGAVGGTLHLHRVLPSFRLVLELLFSSSIFLPVAALAVAAVVVALFARERTAAVFFAAAFGTGIVAFAWTNWSQPGLPLVADPGLNPTRSAVGALVLLAVALTPLILARALETQEPQPEDGWPVRLRRRVPFAYGRLASAVARPAGAAGELALRSPGAQRLAAVARREGLRWSYAVGVPFFFVACLFTYYGQLNRTQTGDVVGAIYTSVAIVKQHTIWLDAYFPIIQHHLGPLPYMVTTGPGGHEVSSTPSAASLLALPVVAVFSLAGVGASSWGVWMEASMLSAAVVAAASVAVLFVALTRLTSRRRAGLIAATYAWGTLQWGISGQALWQHTGATLALAVALLALIDRRLTLAGAALALMVACRPNAAVIVLFLLPLVGRRPRDWGRFLLGTAPFVLPLLAYNTVAFGSPLHQGYGTAHLVDELIPSWTYIRQGLPGLLLSPGIGLVVYSPVLVFAVYGYLRGRSRSPLYLWCGIASMAYVVSAANSAQWYGGQSFGPRRLTDLLPLLAILLVPALDAIVRTRWLWVYLAALAWSVVVELLAAAAPVPTRWWDTHADLASAGVWWHVADNQIATKLSYLPLQLAWRMLAMVALLAFAVIAGVAADWVLKELRRARKARSMEQAMS